MTWKHYLAGLALAPLAAVAAHPVIALAALGGTAVFAGSLAAWRILSLRASARNRTAVVRANFDRFDRESHAQYAVAVERAL